MSTISAKVNGFAKSQDNPEYKVVFVSTVVLDDYTGLERTVKRTYLCVQSFYFQPLLNKECVLEVVHSPKLDKDVCVNIREVK